MQKNTLLSETIQCQLHVLIPDASDYLKSLVLKYLFIFYYYLFFICFSNVELFFGNSQSDCNYVF